jgi:hypothetical protein
MPLLVILLAYASLAFAQVETQHALDATLPLHRKLEVTLHARVRTRPGDHGIYQTRAGPLVSWDWHPRASWIAGYYYAEEERDPIDEAIGRHRYFGGGELVAASNDATVLDTRILVERFIFRTEPDFSRYRGRLRLNSKARLGPYTSSEFFFDRQGWRSTRIAGGVRWRITESYEIDFGYFYEPRRAEFGSARHMFITSFHYKRVPKLGDPDP